MLLQCCIVLNCKKDISDNDEYIIKKKNQCSVSVP